MKSFQKIVFGAIALSFLSTTAFAEEKSFADSLVTDRPDAAEASETVGKKVFQLETSISFTQDKAAGTTTRTYNFPTLLRFGLLDNFELRIEGAMLQIQTQSDQDRETGFTDLDFGVKWHLQAGDKWKPSLGLLAHLTTPTGKEKEGFSSDVVEPSFKVLMDWDLPRGFSIGTNLGFDVPAGDGQDKFARALYAAALGIPSPWLEERLGFFIEFSGAIPTISGKTEEHYFDSGITFLITPDIQIDIASQLGLNGAAADLNIGTGVSVRF